MYHQKIPSYDGAQPFIYAAYCKEDESLAYPVLARMYNEGFRVCCAPSTGVASDYYKQQRLQSASGVIMFMSSHMAERLRTGDPDVLAAARNPLLRTVILLDDTDVKNNIFAMSVPDHQPYIRENDSAFWLYIYSNDHFDKCRGKWPEKQLLLRDPVYEDISEEVVSEEYQRLQNIMSGRSSDRKSYDPFDPDTLYENNPGYIEPEPDDLVYEPLERVRAARTEQDDQYDEVLDLINQAETAVEQSRQRTADATAAAAKNAQDYASEVAKQQLELEKEIANAPSPEVIIVTTEKLELVEGPEIPEPAKASEPEPEPAPEPEPKADLIVTPVEPEPEKTPEPEAAKPALPELTPITKEDLDAAVETIIASAGVLFSKAAEPEQTAPQPVSEPEPEAKPEPAAAEPETSAEPPIIKRTSKAARRSSVPVMVRRQTSPQRSKVEVKTRRQMHVSATPTEDNRSAMHLSSIPAAEGSLPHAISDSITFEQYVRDIARSYVNELLEQPEEPAASPAPTAPPARRHRQRGGNTAVQPEPETQPQYSIELEAVEPEAAEEQKSARKSRHPHLKSSFFANIISALRSEHHRSKDGSVESDTDELSESSDSENIAADVPASDAPYAEAEPEEKAALSGGSSISAGDSGAELQLVVEKFIECNRVPSITVVPRTMIRRYRD